MATLEIEELLLDFYMVFMATDAATGKPYITDHDAQAMLDHLEIAFTTLTTKHQEEIEKAVEAERERIVSAMRDEYGGDFLGDGVRVGTVLHKLQALTPTKTDKQ